MHTSWIKYPLTLTPSLKDNNVQLRVMMMVMFQEMKSKY